MRDPWVDRAHELLGHKAVARVRRQILENDSETVSCQVALSEIPAPPFLEAERAAYTRTCLIEAGCHSVSIDAAGNVLGRLGPDGPTPLVISAHLDTVFPAGTDVTVTRSNGRLMGPGISDDARGLAALIALARGLARGGLQLAGSLLFVATVGEEGEGNLRGVRHLFGPTGEGRGASGFISFDGAGLSRVVNRGLGVRRLRAVARGGGGHSWVNWGAPNPLNALGIAVDRIARMPTRTGPVATATVARWGGGTSINAIPSEGWIELDLRSEVAGLLARMETAVRVALDDAVAEINSTAPPGLPPVTLSVEVIGDRPAGITRAEELLVQAALAASSVVGVEARLIASSTDANVPMALRIPAITLGAGGAAGGAHTLDEWYENRDGPDGIIRALITTLLMVGLAEG
jgi:acetylornithine deacetylase/succinyl-diaminopimelate desuccinylase-like protein